MCDNDVFSDIFQRIDRSVRDYQQLVDISTTQDERDFWRGCIHGLQVARKVVLAAMVSQDAAGWSKAVAARMARIPLALD